MENLPSRFNLGQATDSVLKLKEDVGKGIIALGQWISLTKKNLPKTEWLDWLKYEVNIGTSTAYKWIQMSKQFTYRDLEKVGHSKLFEMMSLPDGQFKEELLEKAPIMTEKEIRQKVEDFSSTRISEQEEIEGEAVEELDPNIESKFKSVLEVLNTLQGIDVDSIPDNFKDFLSNQVRKMITFLEGFLLALEDARTEK